MQSTKSVTLPRDMPYRMMSVIPDDVCNTFTVTYRKLKEFEDDLHKHVHLENNILSLKAMQL